jgi:hypothetical protein
LSAPKLITKAKSCTQQSTDKNTSLVTKSDTVIKLTKKINVKTRPINIPANPETLCLITAASLIHSVFGAIILMISPTTAQRRINKIPVTTQSRYSEILKLKKAEIIVQLITYGMAVNEKWSIIFPKKISVTFTGMLFINHRFLASSETETEVILFVPAIKHRVKQKITESFSAEKPAVVNTVMISSLLITAITADTSNSKEPRELFRIYIGVFIKYKSSFLKKASETSGSASFCAASAGRWVIWACGLANGSSPPCSAQSRGSGPICLPRLANAAPTPLLMPR